MRYKSAMIVYIQSYGRHNEMSEFTWLTTEDNCALYVKHWGKTITEPKAVVQISHGMAEHIHRYHEFAAFLNECGFIVYGEDHRGHGQTGDKQGKLGYFAKEKGFQFIVEDMHLLTKHIQKEHPSLPIFIFGHSMGSFITRNYLQKYSNAAAGVILSGTGFFPSVTSYLGRSMASLLPPQIKSKIMNNLVFGRNNKVIQNPRTTFDWLTRDHEVVDEYIKDPFSGFIPTAQFFVDLLTGIITMQDKTKNIRLRKDLPILFLSGDKDPVGNYGKGVFHSAKAYHDAEIENIAVQLYAGARHELLHEINKAEVFEDVEQWIVKQLAASKHK